MRSRLRRWLRPRPAGRWHEDADAPEPGTRILRPGAVAPGVSLVVAGHAPEALLIDARGGLLHRWTLPMAEAWPGFDPRARPERAGWRRARLLADGSLVVCCTGLGVLRIDRGSKPLWRHPCDAHHDVAPGVDGTLHALARDPSGRDEILVLDPDGGARRRIDVARCFERGLPDDPLAGLRDLHHPNGIDLLACDHPAAGPAFRAGTALVSIRTAHRLALLDLDDERVLWHQDGPWREPHSPRMLDDGSVLLFDNLGASGPGGRSRVIELDPARREILWSHAGSPGHPLDSPKGGACQRLPGGNTLVTESTRARAFEITREGERVWEFVHPARAGRGRLVPYLCEVTRHPERTASFLTGDAPVD